jgi:hypothetical protein
MKSYNPVLTRLPSAVIAESAATGIRSGPGAKQHRRSTVHKKRFMLTLFYLCVV